MDDSKLHPSVREFKQFLKDNPKIVRDVRLGKKTWQDLYEDWSLLGEKDERWAEYMDDEAQVPKAAEESPPKGEKIELVSQLFNQLKNMDPEQIQKQITNISQALGAIQGVISQFQSSGKNEQPPSAPPSSKHPFSFRQD
ncbi:YlbD family protein [Pradoshia sp.]